jgi:rhodanese-related sulfurtransferase
LYINKEAESLMTAYRCITVQQAREIIENQSCTVLDIRDEQSFNQSRLPDAVRFNDMLIRQMRKAGKQHSSVLVYCYHGISSRDIAKMLCDFGFTEVYSLDGGFAAWQSFSHQATAQPAPEIVNNNSPLHHWITQQGFNTNDLNWRDDMGMTALMQASRFGLCETVKALIDAGADINLTNNDGNNALWLACFSGDQATIDALIQSGINIDQQNTTGATALMYSASAGKADVVRLLLDARADPHLKSQDDYTAFDLAATPQVYRLLRNLVTVTA